MGICLLYHRHVTSIQFNEFELCIRAIDMLSEGRLKSVHTFILTALY